MNDAGASFKVQPRGDSLGVSFTYSVAEAGDIEACRAILAAVKAQPPQFAQAFKQGVVKQAGVTSLPRRRRGSDHAPAS